MSDTHEVVDFGEPFYGERLCPPPMSAERLIQSNHVPDSPCELGEGPIYRPEDNTLHFVDLLSASVRRLEVSDVLVPKG